MLEFLAKRLVSKPDVVTVEYFPGDDDEQPVLELVVDPDDLGKVIGRGGRVAQALRTVVRATAEGKIAVDIYDTQDGENGETGDVEAGGDDTEP
ncbi:MAG: KH domain-containing protein [Firmicutes bacterium]|nr:KH domain-containing protein [Bacillota bacterium]